MKDLLRRQVLVLISSANSEKFMILSNKHVANINKALKNIKSAIMSDFIWADFIWADGRGFTIITNKVTSTLDLNIIEKYIKNINVVNLNNIMLPRLLQSKSYLKILGISYHIEKMNILITANIIKRVLQSTYIFNDIILVSKPQVIKTFSKLDMVVIWINIWNAQSNPKAKSLINRYFNIESHIMTIQVL